jgi:four helix bundle protein
MPMRDHTKLRAFQLADELVLAVYQATADFPSTEQFGLTSQIRRATVSIASNIVEGCARSSLADYLRFLDMAYGSSREAAYQTSIARRMQLGPCETLSDLESKATETSKMLNGLVRSLRKKQ